jgi:hypothetical protein
MNLDLDKRIAVALTSASTCADIAVLIAEAEAALLTAIDAVERDRIKALDPTVEVHEARQSLADAEFARDRLQAALAVLHARLQELQAQEHSEQWNSECAQVEAECHALAAEMREVYPASVRKLIDLLIRKKACDAKISRINGSAPAGVSTRLREVELVARNLRGFTQGEPPISKELRLPDWEQSNKLAWPPPQTPLGVLVAQSMAAVDHPSGRWLRQREERLRELQAK